MASGPGDSAASCAQDASVLGATRTPASATEPDAVTPVSDCRCFLSAKPPDGTKWWRPDLEDDPGGHVQTVVRYGDDPAYRRAVRRQDGMGWDEHGSMVDFYQDITPPMPWQRVGRCRDNTPHPVVAVKQGPDGTWTFDG